MFKRVLFPAMAVVAFSIGSGPAASVVPCADPGAQCPRPIQFGVSGININEVCSAGTLGAYLNLGGTQVILSNNHVLARENAGVTGSDRIVQPGTLDNTPQCAVDAADSVGVLAHFIPINFGIGGSNLFDMAFAGTSGAFVDTTGDIANIGLVSETPFPGTPPIGTAVKKQGRTTDLTFGQIDAVNVSSLVSYSSGLASFQNQYRITPGTFSAGGDSGSLIVEDTATCPRAIGLLFAGSASSTLANPLNLFLSFTGFNIVGDGSCPAANASAPAQSTGTIPTSGQAMRHAMDVQDRNEAALFARPGVVGVGIGRDAASGGLALEVYVESAAAAQQAFPSALDGVPVNVIETGPFEAF